jgi:hypothetical protein
MRDPASLSDTRGRAICDGHAACPASAFECGARARVKGGPLPPVPAKLDGPSWGGTLTPYNVLVPAEEIVWLRVQLYSQ